MEKRFKHIVKILLLMVMVIPAVRLAGQSSYTVNVGTTDIYSITSQPNINDYLWEAYLDANLTSPAAPADVTLTSLGAGRENEIEVTWNSTGTRYLAITVTDTEGCTNRMAWTFNVVANQPPVANDDTNQTIETNPVDQDDGSGNLLANDSDPESGGLTVASINGNTTGTVAGLYGTLVWNTDGTYTYTPNAQMDTLQAGESVDEVFSVVISDPLSLTSTSTLTITINGENAEPLLANDTNETIETIVITESSPLSSGNLLANDTDVDGETLSIESVDGNTTGTLAGVYGTLYWNDDGTYTYVPNTEMDTLTAVESVNDVFTYTAIDGSGGSDSATLTITINGENDIPVAYNDFNSTLKTTPVNENDGTGSLLANDVDRDGDALTITSVEGDATGLVVGNYGILTWNADGTYIYTPNVGMDTLQAGESVIEVFTYQVDDPYGGYDTATLTITISGENEGPVLANDTNSTTETTPVSHAGPNSSGNLLANDTDPNGDNITIESIDGDLTGTVTGTYGTLTWYPDGTYTYTPNVEMDTLGAGESVIEVFTYTGIDGHGGSGTATLSITINGLNDAPVLADDTNSTIELISVDETDGSGNLLANDSDPNDDPLTISSINGNTTGVIAGTYGTLTWNPDGTYTYTPNAGLDTLALGESVLETFTYTATDGMGGSNTAQLTITINGANADPVANNDTNSTIETVVVDETDGSGNLLANDTDIDGDLLSVASVDGDLSGNISGVYGTLTWNSDGTYTYTPNAAMDSLAAGENVDEVFTVTIDDGNGGTDTSTLTITINGNNDDPVASNDTNSTLETNPVTEAEGSGNLLANDSDPDGDPLVVQSIDGDITGTVSGTYGTLTWNADGTYTYTPNAEMDSLAAGESVSEIFNQVISDGNGGTDTALLTITLNGQNNAPVAQNDINSTIRSAPIDETDGSGTLLQNDIDIDGDALTVTSVEGNTTGTVVGTYGTLTWHADGTYEYVPNPEMDTLIASESVQEIFNYTASDGSLTDNADLIITISGENVPPVLADDTNSTTETIPVNQDDGSGNLLSNDTDANGDALAISSIDGDLSGTVTGTYGTLTWLPNGDYVYTPNIELDSLLFGEDVIETFTITVTDNNGEFVNSTLTITIYGENDAPLVADDTNSTIETTPVDETDGSGNLLANDSDAEGDPLVIASIDGDITGTVLGTYGTIVWNADGTYTYTPNPELDSLAAGENVVEIFNVTVSDGNGGTTVSTLTITINGQNEAPVALDDTNATVETTPVDETDGSGNLLANDTDADGDNLTITEIDGNTTGTLVGTYGTLSWNPDGTYTYTPNAEMDSLNAGESVDDIFTYTVSDGNGETASAALTITISGENAYPVLADDTNQTIEVNPVNESDGSGNLLANDTDPDGDELTITEIDGNTTGIVVGTYGTLTWNPDGTYTYTPNPELDTLAVGETVIEEFTYTASDGNGGTDTATLSITIQGENTDPVLVDDTNATIEILVVDETDGSGNLLANDYDPDGNPLSVYEIDGVLTGTVVGTYGSLVWNPNGTYTYIPNAEMDSLLSFETVYEVFTYTAIDGLGGSSTATLTISITGENQPPVLADDTNQTTETTPVDEADGSGNLLANDIDPDGDPLIVASIDGDNTGIVVGTYGTLEWNPDGTYTYTPNEEMDTLAIGESVEEIFTYMATDGMHDVTARLTVTINGENDNPVAQNDTNETIETTPVDETDGSGNLLANDSDPDGDPLNVASIDGDGTGTVVGTYGTLTWNPDGTYTYTPNTELDSLDTGESVIETFNVTVSDGNGGTSVSVLTITIEGRDENLPPVAETDYITVEEDVEDFPVSVLSNDYDPNGDDLSVSLVSLPVSGGEVTIIGDVIYYTPPADFFGDDYFLYRICDNGIPSLCDVDTVFITVTPVNDPPVANTDYGNVPANSEEPVVVDILENDYDPEGDDLTASIVSGPTMGGDVTLNEDGTISYIPPAGFIGTDTIIYQICDNGSPSLCDIDTIFIDVFDRLEAIDDYYSLYAGEQDTFIILENDLFAGLVDVTIIDDFDFGTFELNPDGSITYTAPSDYVGNDTLNYVISNGSGSDTAMVVVTIKPLVEMLVQATCSGETPLIMWDVSITGVTVSTIDLILYNANGDTIQEITDSPLNSWIEWPGVTYNEYGFAIAPGALLQTLSLEAVYSQPPFSEKDTSTFSYPDCHNNVVVAVWDTFTVSTSTAVLDVLENDFDPDEGDIDTLSLAVQDTLPYWRAQHGTATPNGNGQITYIPDPGYSGPDSFVYVICDDWTPQIACDTAIVWLDVIWDPHMIAVDDEYWTYMNNQITMAVHSNDIDPNDGLDLSTVQLLSDPENGNAIVNSNGTITYIPLNGFVGLDSLSYEICNSDVPRECDSAWVTIRVVVNNNILAVHDDTLTNAGDPVEIPVLENDIDPENQLDSSSVTITYEPEYGTVTITDDHTIWYEPQPGFAGLDSFIYRVCDLGFPKTCDTAVVYISIIDNNVALVANPDDTITGENIEVVIPILVNDYDPDGYIDTTSITIVENPANGSVTIGHDGTISYEPVVGFAGIDSFIYQLCDNGPVIACDTALVTITVVENLPPVAINDTIDAVNGDGNVTNIVLNDYDLDDGLESSSVEIITPVENGSFTIDENGFITYIPDYCFFDTDSFTYVIYDTYGNVSNVATVYLNVRINPSLDADLDGALDLTEDINGNGTPCDDDTDGDGIPNFLDEDDDGDGALTIYEDWNNNGDPTDDDTDGDGIPNYLDTDDDDDSVLSINEDINGDGNPLNDDTDGDGLPNFIDPNDDDDFWMTIDEVADLDQNGILDYLEIWDVYAVNDNVNSGIDLAVNIPVLENDSSQFDYSTLYILRDPENGFAYIEDDFTVSYEPNMEFTGIDSFLYTICDYYQVCDTASVIINVEDILFFPELFTPNGDGVNDYYVITGIEKYPDNHFEVYNRWGNKVYEADGYFNEWDGWANVRFVIGNNELPVGVYYYILRYNKTLEKAGALFLER